MRLAATISKARIRIHLSGWLLVVCCVVGAGFAKAQSPTVKARVDSAVMLIGDPNRLVVTLSAENQAARVGWEVLDTMDAFVITGDEQRETVGGELRLALPFSVYDSVGLLLPPLPVYLPEETLYTNDLALMVNFPPTGDTPNPYRSIRVEPAQLEDYLPWVLGGALILLLLGLAGWLLYRAGKQTAVVVEAAPVAEAADVIALRDLGLLRTRTDYDDKAYYSELDRVLRQYLENRYQVPALERTSDEVRQLLRGRGVTDVAELGGLLSAVDLIKFARAKLPPEARDEAVERVVAFVKSTKPVVATTEAHDTLPPQ